VLFFISLAVSIFFYFIDRLGCRRSAGLHIPSPGSSELLPVDSEKRPSNGGRNYCDILLISTTCEFSLNQSKHSPLCSPTYSGSIATKPPFSSTVLSTVALTSLARGPVVSGNRFCPRSRVVGFERSSWRQWSVVRIPQVKDPRPVHGQASTPPVKDQRVVQVGLRKLRRGVRFC